ncbi:alpha/beta fold hydrolase [Rickettsia endosymbiont of Halotydeus destructor]|uniref:S9 family peptidase n=1 Tax=Rickettsia endosymbiont of Halotydeus destructor TaxID=2996754 RepID=UPI003BAFCA86
MKLKIIFVIICWIVILSTARANTSPKDIIIPREVLFSYPDKIKISFSPNGKYISYLGNNNEVLDLLIADSENLENIKAAIKVKTGVYDYIWAYDNQHILYLKDVNNDKNYRLYSYDLETNHTKLLTTEKGITAKIFAKRATNKPYKILIGLKSSNQHYFDVYELNLLDHSKKLIMKNNKFSSFIFDNDLNIRLGIFINNKGEKEYFRLKNNQWLFLMRLSNEDIINTKFYDFDHTNNNIYLLDGRDNNTVTLKLLNLNTGVLKLLAKDKRVDINVLTSHPTIHEIQAIVTEYDKVEYKILDNSIKRDIKYLQNLNLGNIHIIHRTLDDQIWFIEFYSDVNPTKYYKYNRQKKQIKFLFCRKAELEKYRLAPMNPIIIKSRDGLNLVSYITFPNNMKLSRKIYPNKPSSLVLLVHGGPAIRNSWGMNTEHQWLANRGYIVLSVNFRGSAGFGKDFLNSGNGEWGKKMQDDLIDAVNWAIKNKIADPRKIAIMGSSYGGYAALAGLTFTPNLFACGVDIAGPPDLLTALKNLSGDWKFEKYQAEMKIGPSETAEQREKLRHQSPLTYVKSITKPLLIIQGGKDSVIKQTESDRMVAAMVKYNKPIIYALYKDENHNFCNIYNNISYHIIIEQFLAKYLGGKTEPINYTYLGNPANLLLNGKPPFKTLLIELLEAR